MSSFFPEKIVGQPNVFIGVDVGYGDSSVAYNVSTAVLGYANLIIVGSTEVTSNQLNLLASVTIFIKRAFTLLFTLDLGMEKLFRL